MQNLQPAQTGPKAKPRRYTHPSILHLPDYANALCQDPGLWATSETQKLLSDNMVRMILIRRTLVSTESIFPARLQINDVGSDVRFLHLFSVFNLHVLLEPSDEELQGLFIRSHRLWP